MEDTESFTDPREGTELLWPKFELLKTLIPEEFAMEICFKVDGSKPLGKIKTGVPSAVTALATRGF